ncbi:MAG: GAF domain-containing protein, partial [Flavobacteriaceae bacterium]
NVWFSSTEGHILHYSDNRLIRTHDLTHRGAGIFFMNADQQGDLWFCQAPSEQPIVGVAKITTEGKVKEYGKKEGIDNRILVVREGGRNELYAAGIGTNSYLYKYDRNTDHFQNKSLPFSFEVSGNFEVHDMAIDGLGIVWLATTDGLLKYDTESIRKVDLGAYTHGEVRSITALDDGEVWISTDTNGLIYLDSAGNYVRFDEKCGTPSRVASYRSLILDKDSRLWVGTAEGAVYSSRSSPRPLLTQTPLLKSADINNEGVKRLEKIKMSEYDQLTLNMGTVTYPGSEVHYEYKIFDQNLPEDELPDISWVSSNSKIVLDELSEGSYKLLTRAQKEGGYSWSSPIAVNLEVAKKWYKRWWSWLLFSVILAVFLRYFARQWILTQVSGLQAKLSQQQQELDLKTEALEAQSHLLKNKKEELKTVGANVYMLHKLIDLIPPKADWDDVLTVIKRLTELPTGIDAAYLTRKKSDKMVFSGYQRNRKAKVLLERNFNEKENLPSIVLASGKPITISDYDKQFTQYLLAADELGYLSRLLIPIRREKDTIALLCIYAENKGVFSSREETLLRILTSFLSANLKPGLK